MNEGLRKFLNEHLDGKLVRDYKNLYCILTDEGRARAEHSNDEYDPSGKEAMRSVGGPVSLASIDMDLADLEYTRVSILDSYRRKGKPIELPSLFKVHHILFAGMGTIEAEDNWFLLSDFTVCHWYLFRVNYSMPADYTLHAVYHDTPRKGQATDILEQMLINNRLMFSARPVLILMSHHACYDGTYDYCVVLIAQKDDKWLAATPNGCCFVHPSKKKAIADAESALRSLPCGCDARKVTIVRRDWLCYF